MITKELSEKQIIRKQVKDMLLFIKANKRLALMGDWQSKDNLRFLHTKELTAFNQFIKKWW